MVTINAHQLFSPFPVCVLKNNKTLDLKNTVLMNIAHIKYFSSKLNQTFITNQTKQLSKTVLILSIRLIKKYHKSNLKSTFQIYIDIFILHFPF